MPTRIVSVAVLILGLTLGVRHWSGIQSAWRDISACWTTVHPLGGFEALCYSPSDRVHADRAAHISPIDPRDVVERETGLPLVKVYLMTGGLRPPNSSPLSGPGHLIYIFGHEVADPCSGVAQAPYVEVSEDAFSFDGQLQGSTIVAACRNEPHGGPIEVFGTIPLHHLNVSIETNLSAKVLQRLSKDLYNAFVTIQS